MIKVAFFFHDSDFFSGATRSLLDLLDYYLNDKNVYFICFFPDKNGTAIDYLRAKGISVFYSKYSQLNVSLTINKLDKVRIFPKLFYNLVKSKIYLRTKTLKIIKKNKIDILYDNTSTILPGIWLKKWAHIKCVTHLREFGEEDQNFTIWFGRKKYFGLLQKSDLLICISQAIYSKYYLELKNNKFVIIPDDVSSNYINSSKTDIYQKFNDETFNILIAGTLCEGKGQLEAIKELAPFLKEEKKACLFLAYGYSNPNYEKKVRNFVLVNKLDQSVILLGLVKDMNDLRKTMKIGIVASSFEAFGRVTVEGMLSGMVIVGKKSGGTKEIINDGVNGFLYSIENGHSLLSIIEKLFKDKCLCIDIAQKAFEYGKKYTQNRCAISIIKNCYDLLEEN